MTRFLAFLECSCCTFRIWSLGKKNRYLKCVSSIFWLWQLNYIWSTSEEVPLLHWTTLLITVHTFSLLLLFHFT